MKADEYKELVSKVTPEPHESKTIWAETSKLCMMFIEFRYMDILKYNLWNIANVYGGGDTSLVIVHSGDNRDIIMETTKNWKNVRYIQAMEKNQSVHEYDRLITSADFWSKFSEFDHVLTNTWDSYIFKQIPEKFFEYDMVGGPVAHFYIVLNGRLMNICADECKCPRCLEGDHMFKAKNFIDYPHKYFLYNGGLVLRKVKTSIELCEKKTWTGEPDDVYFSISDLTKPTLEEACEFAVNHIKHPDPIGCHQVWIHDEEFVRSLFK